MFHFAKVLIVSTILTFSCHAQRYDLLPVSVKKCPVVGQNPIDFDVSLGSDGFGLTAKLDRILDKECLFENKLEQNNGGFWVLYLTTNGNACETLANIQPSWDLLKSSMKPALKEACSLPPGSYILKDYKVSKEEVEQTNLINGEGRFRSTTTLSCQGEQLACLQIEVEATEAD